jgi:hypothetical protein
MSDADAPPPEQAAGPAVPEQIPVVGPPATGSAAPTQEAWRAHSDMEMIVGRVFDHVPHPRYEHHRLAGPTTRAEVAKEVHGSGFFGRINRKVGLRITLIVGTMWAAYLFFGLALYGLPQALRSGPSAIVLWTSSEFLQLVLLPIIIVGQNIQAKASDARAEDTYKDAEAIMHECLQLQEHLQAQDKLLLETIVHVHRLAGVHPAANPAL